MKRRQLLLKRMSYNYYTIQFSGRKSFVKAKLKEHGKWIILHSSALLWLLIGAIITITMFYYPKREMTAPVKVECGQGPTTLLLNPGVDLFWLSSVTVILNDKGYSTVYVANISCKSAPTITIHDSRPNSFPYYLAHGSNLTVHNSLDKEVDFWYINSLDCDSVDFSENCDNHHDIDRTCERLRANASGMPFVVNESDYYSVCANPDNYEVFVDDLNLVQYNLTAIQLSSVPRKLISQTVNLPLMNLFEFKQRDLCLFMELDCNSVLTSEKFLTIEAHMRGDVMLLTMLLALLLSTGQLSITVCVHICHWRMLAAAQVKRNKDLII